MSKTKKLEEMSSEELIAYAKEQEQKAEQADAVAKELLEKTEALKNQKEGKLPVVKDSKGNQYQVTRPAVRYQPGKEEEKLQLVLVKAQDLAADPKLVDEIVKKGLSILSPVKTK
jgi:Zn-dependent peptidase ImmA (M78 family)